MINSLKTENVGPGNVNLEFRERLNLFTGDNGLGKSFLFDIIWFAHTRTWPRDVNKAIKGGYLAMPIFDQTKQESTIRFKLFSAKEATTYTYDNDELKWKTSKRGQPTKSGLVFYITAEGNYCLYDSYRSSDENPSEVFTERDLWEGNKEKVIRGLLDDLIVWKNSNDDQDKSKFDVFLKLFQSISNDPAASIGPSAILAKARSLPVPTINLGIQKNVPIVFLSTAIKRVLTIAYFVSWAYGEHVIYAKTNKGGVTAQDVTIIIDELDVHLHPKWQSTILAAVLKIKDLLTVNGSTQFFVSTHSPIVMVNAEPLWDEIQDRWIDIDVINNEVVTQVRTFEKLGRASSYLTGDAFDLKDERSLEAQKVIEEYNQLADRKVTMPEPEWNVIYEKLEAVVPRNDRDIWLDVELTLRRRKANSSND